MRERFALTLHGVIYRLILGAIVLAIVIPVGATGYRPMWPFALMAIAVVFIVFSVLQPILDMQNFVQ